MRWTITIMMLALALMISAPASVALAQEGGCDPGCDPGCGDGCCDPGCGGLVADIELTLLRYFQEGGVDDFQGSPVEFDYEFAPRFVLGYVGPGGLGVRARYWEIDGAATSAAGVPVGVNAYNIDVEAFQDYCLGCNTTLELSAGVRYAELWQDVILLETEGMGIAGFSGFGGTMAAEVNRAVFRGDVYARARLSVLMGDAVVHELDAAGAPVFSAYADDCTAAQTELALGYEICRCTNFGMLTLRTGVEWQNWANMAFAGTPFGVPADVMEDAGFAGFVFGLGLER